MFSILIFDIPGGMGPDRTSELIQRGSELVEETRRLRKALSDLVLATEHPGWDVFHNALRILTRGTRWCARCQKEHAVILKYPTGDPYLICPQQYPYPPTELR